MIIYQIYPRSFLDTNGDGIGDIAGILRKLDYLQELGVDTLWISPFYESPMRDFGYDIADHRAVDPSFGTMSDFQRLVQRSAQLSIKVLVDLVASHTSDQHAWFHDSVRRAGGKSDWYLWADPKSDGTPPNNWLSVFGGSAWRWHPLRRQYYYHAFLPSQPDLNLHVPAVQDEILGIMRFWLEHGVAGFRLDACNHYFQDALLRDNPPNTATSSAFAPYAYQVHLFDQGRPEVIPFLARMRAVLDEYGAFSVGEVGGTDPVALMGEYTGPEGLHSAYSFALMRNDHSAEYLRRTVTHIQRSVRSATPCYAFSNHDKPRVVTRWGRGRDENETAKLFLALLTALPGLICLYHGEELGLPQAEIPHERLQDPYGKTFWPVFPGRDGCRTPMPWTSGTHAGFSTHEPWLPIPERHAALNVDAQLRDAGSPLTLARQAIALRKARPELSRGSIRFLVDEGDVLAFIRSDGKAAVTCAFNLAATGNTLPLCCGRGLLSQNATPGETQLELGVNGFWIGEPPQPTSC